MKLTNEQKTINEFERKFAKFVGKKYGVSVNSGFSALFVALKASGIGPGDEVIVPDFTFVATANAVSLTGAKPVFVDVLENGTIDPMLIMEAVTVKTKAIIPVHLYARRADLERIQVLADQLHLKIIEDCAEAIGNKGIGEKGCWSFQYAKTISTEQGGMITTDDEEFAKECRLIASYYNEPDKPYYHQAIGFNFRMTAMQARMGLDTLKILPYKLKEMKRAGDLLSDTYEQERQENYWVFVSDKLPSNKGRPGFIPMHQLPPYAGSTGSFPVSDKLSKTLRYVYLWTV